MPEYLAPGVYVEEVDTGAKPIEGVSTSTCGMVGVTERGPADVPVLVTSVGEFARWFGGQLRRGEDYGDHRFLPHAVEGFFTNGGKRVYVVRTVDAAATRAAGSLFDRGGAMSVATRLLRPAGEGTGAAAAPPPLLALPVTGLAANDWLRIGEGSTAEYRQAGAAPVAETVMVPLHLPLSRSHPAGEPAEQYARAVTEAYAVAEAVAPGDTTLVLSGANADITTLQADVAASAPGDVVLEIGAAAVAEHRTVAEVTGVRPDGATDSTARVRLSAPVLLAQPAGTVVSRVDLSAGVVQAAVLTGATAASALAFVDDRQGALDDRTALVVVGAGAEREVRRIGQLAEVGLAPAPASGIEAGSLVEVVELSAARTLSAAAAAGDGTVVLQPGEAAGLVAGQRLQITSAGTPQTVTVQSVDLATSTVTVTPLGAAASAGDEVVPNPAATTAAVPAGSRVLAVSDRTGVTVGALIRVGAGAASQLVTVTSLPAQTRVAPDAGNVVVTPALASDSPAGTAVQLVGTAALLGGRQGCALVLPVAAGQQVVLLSDAAGFAAGETVRITSLGGDVSYHALASGAAPVVPELLTLQTGLSRSHPAGSAAVGRAPLVDVEALDAGSWGNRLRISVTDDDPAIVSRTTLTSMVNPNAVRLASRSGVQPGTVLEFRDPVTGAVLGDHVKVRSVDRASGTLLLDGAGLAPVQQALGTVVRSREFTLTVSLLRQPDPATPSRDGQVVDREVFRNLSLDPRHSNYIGKVIGSVGGVVRTWDHRPEGSSLYVRVTDRAATPAAAEAVRLGPEALVDVQADGRRQPARMRLEAVLGDDSIGSMTDDHYLGADNADPDLRTGLQSLRNVEQVSLVAVPGRHGARVQQGLIDHCELMRYRFAVLDSRAEPADTVSDVQDQRQQFDSTYAALYYPWLSIPDPFPDLLTDVHDYAVPPSGHVLGIYARTDIERGVHKAPANEVVRGITGVRRKVNKEQQDVLNPYPVNVNVIRDFRDDNRGIRVYGGRVITSDPDWKYVNVRRLLIFLEASIDRGLQWVVFEPNSEPLWARVRRTISNFLTVVWRNGALEGVDPEEAFFVRCDRTTMTQTDVDAGRLIVQVGVAPVKPAEFVIVRIGLWTARSDS